MNIRDQKLLARIIFDHIDDIETNINFKLPTADRELLVSLCINFIHMAVPKFVKGSKEHGNTLVSRPALPELQNEILDAYIYLQAALIQLKDICKF